LFTIYRPSGWFYASLDSPIIKRSSTVTNLLLEIADQLVGALQPDRQPQQVGRAGGAGTFDAGAVLDQALDSAERGGALPQLHVGGGGDGDGLSALHAHRQHAAEAAPHLPRGDGVPGVRLEARIEHRLHARMPGEVPRNS